MAGKKAKPRKTTKKLDFDSLKPSDVLCPICRTILIEPVTLSCDHAFCKLCFEGTMENANLVCPLCRVRVGSWFRKAKKDGKLVDEKLWGAIQAQYPKEVQNRYRGIDNAMEADVPIIVVATPGEIRKEYEQHRQKEFEEQKKIKEAEEKASAPLIKKFKEEEEHQKRLEEEKIRLDAALARKLAEDLERPTTSKVSSKKPENNKRFGPMDRFIKIEEAQSNRISSNKSEEKKSYKVGRRISVTPNPASDFATKEYTCHVLNAESGSKKPVNYLTILNKSSYNKSSYTSGMPTSQKKVKQVKQTRNIIEIEQRKSICKSGYKSSESGSDDTIGQECRFYFKPIDTQRRYHLPGTIPLKVPSLMGKPAPKVYIEPPSGKIINLQLGTVISAFASFSLVLHQNPQSHKSPTHEVIEKESSERHVGPSNRLKRKLSYEDGPIKRKGRRHIYTKKTVQNMNSREAVSSPFYGFDNESSRLVNSSPFYGFNTLEIKKSNREKDALRKLIDKREQNVIDNKSLVSTEGLYKTFRTYSKHQNRQFKGSKVLINNDTQPHEVSLKLEILKKPKNGINMSEAIKNKLAELRNSVDGPSEDFKSRINIDVNRNIPKKTSQQSLRNFDGRSKDLSNESYNRSSIDITSAHINRCNMRLSIGDNNKLESSSNDLDIIPILLKGDAVKSNKVDCAGDDFPVAISTRKISSGKIVDTEPKSVDSNDIHKSDKSNLSGDNTTNSSFKRLDASSLPVNTRINGSWRTKHENSSPRKVRNNLITENRNSTIEHDKFLVGRISLTAKNRSTAGAFTDFDTKSTNIRLDDAPSHSANKTYQTETKNAVFADKNSKITDTFFKVKSSPTKSKNTIKKLKLSPAKTKFNNNFELDFESIQVNGEIDTDRKHIQEQSDYEMAKKLQAEFDSIQTPSRTRRGTKRQITLDEMLLV